MSIEEKIKDWPATPDQMIEYLGSIGMKVVSNEFYQEAVRLISRKQKEKLPPYLPCVCGKKRASTWYGRSNDVPYVKRECSCGFNIKGSSQKDLRQKWNKAVSE